CATSRDGEDIDAWIRDEAAFTDQGFASDYARRSSLDLFWRRNAEQDFFPLEQMGELTAAAFLGVRIECAQCHKHPFDRWTQADYRAYANIFATVSSNNISPEAKKAIDKENLERKGPNAPKNVGNLNLITKEVYLGPLAKT